MAAHAVRDRARRRSSSSTSTRRIGKTELEYALNKVGCRALVMARRYKSSDYLGMLGDDRAGDPLQGRERGARQRAPAGPEARGAARRRAGAAALPVVRRSCCALGGPAQRARLDALDRRARSRRRDQHPVHERHDRCAEGRDAVALQHRQQRALLRQGDGARARRTGSASRCRCTTASAWCSACCAARRSGATMVFPGEGFDAGDTLRALSKHRCTALHGVPTMFARDARRTPGFAQHDLSSLRTGIMAGAPCPIETMRKVIARMHMQPGDDRLRHDRDVADLVPVGARRSARAPRLDRRPHPAAPRGEDRRRRRPHRAGRRSRASSARAATR